MALFNSFLSLVFVVGMSQSQARGLSEDNAKAEAFANKIKIVKDYSDSEADSASSSRPSIDDPNLAKYREIMRKVYLRAPVFLRNALFDHIETIFLESGSEFIYDAWSTVQNGKNFIGFRKSMVDKNIGFDTNYGSYDQKFMIGGQKDIINPNLPHIVASKDGGLVDAILAQAGHEFGHILLQHDPSLLVKWQQQMGWETKDKIADPELRAIRDGLCLLSSCSEATKVPAKVADEIYRTLARKQWPTIFSMQNAEEDFCESLSYSTVRFRTPDLIYRLSTGEEVNVMDKISRPEGSAFEARRRFLRAAIKRSPHLMKRAMPKPH